MIKLKDIINEQMRLKSWSFCSNFRLHNPQQSLLLFVANWLFAPSLKKKKDYWKSRKIPTDQERESKAIKSEILFGKKVKPDTIICTRWLSYIIVMW